MTLAAQLTGSILILAAFVGVQVHRLSSVGYVYLVANLAGAAFLLATALIEEQWGFVLLEVVWLAVSAWSLVRLLTGRTVDPHALEEL
jgi:hypothetical protein